MNKQKEEAESTLRHLKNWFLAKHFLGICDLKTCFRIETFKLQTNENLNLK